MRCKHKWKMIDKTILTHPIGEAIREGRVMKLEDRGGIEDRIIYVFQCEFCSEVKIEER